MIRLSEFELALFALTRLDMEELVEAGAIADHDYAAWDAFNADRVNWLLMNPAKAPAVWKAIWAYEPAGAKDNVVELKPQRRRTTS
jgi:hypothetical protein